jgi:small subunit ribosomal protein S16
LVKLRLRRMGRKKLPIYKIVAADSRSPRDGRFIDTVGFYNPKANPAEIKFDEKKVNKWLNNGAQPTATVRSLLRNEGIIYRRYLLKKGNDENSVEEKMKIYYEKREDRIKNRSLKKQRMNERKVHKSKKTEAKSE